MVMRLPMASRAAAFIFSMRSGSSFSFLSAGRGGRRFLRSAAAAAAAAAAAVATAAAAASLSLASLAALAFSAADSYPLCMRRRCSHANQSPPPSAGDMSEMSERCETRAGAFLMQENCSG